ncbi:MAG: CBS domain-containing protein [Candidatus Aenigmarchaeota archaeon]|nr:CBS domain-containing protein [Candidatus Aenigmarchaeota archaeon]
MEKLANRSVSSIMRKKFLSISEDKHISDALVIFNKEKINVLPVLKDGDFVGEIHRQDLLKLLINPKDIPEEDVIGLGIGMNFGYAEKTAAEIMKMYEVSITEKTKVKEAAYLMLKEGIGSLPVLRGKKLLGIVSEKDILEEIAKKV